MNCIVPSAIFRPTRFVVLSPEAPAAAEPRRGTAAIESMRPNPARKAEVVGTITEDPAALPGEVTTPPEDEVTGVPGTMTTAPGAGATGSEVAQPARMARATKGSERKNLLMTDLL